MGGLVYKVLGKNWFAWSRFTGGNALEKLIHPPSESADWTLEQSQRLATVYMQFRDDDIRTHSTKMRCSNSTRYSAFSTTYATKSSTTYSINTHCVASAEAA